MQSVTERYAAKPCCMDIFVPAGDTVGMLVTDFGTEKSSVTVLVNGKPACTKYHYERDHSQFFPCITLEDGPVGLVVTWPGAVTQVPSYLHVRTVYQCIVCVVCDIVSVVRDTVSAVCNTVVIVCDIVCILCDIVCVVCDIVFLCVT